MDNAELLIQAVLEGSDPIEVVQAYLDEMRPETKHLMHGMSNVRVRQGAEVKTSPTKRYAALKRGTLKTATGAVHPLSARVSAARKNLAGTYKLIRQDPYQAHWHKGWLKRAGGD